MQNTTDKQALLQELKLAQEHFKKTGSYVWLAEISYKIHLEQLKVGK